MRTIMVVDDDPDIRETLCLLLEAEGHVVVCSANGEEALEQLRQGVRPCLILLDLMMPVMDGFQFRTEQQSDAALAPIPVVAITAAGPAVARRIDAAEVLLKPFGLDDVRDAIDRHC